MSKEVLNPLGIPIRKVNRKRNKPTADVKVKQALQDIQEQKLIEQMEIDFEAEMENSENIPTNIGNKRISEQRKVRLGTQKTLNEMKRHLLTSYLTETTIKGLVLDEDFIESNDDTLRESIKAFYNEAYDEGVINENTFINSPSVLMQEVPGYLSEMADLLYLYRKEGPVTTEDFIYSMVREDDSQVSQTAEEIAEIVKKKVEDTLNKEKEIAEKNDEENLDSESEDSEEVEDELNDEDNIELPEEDIGEMEEPNMSSDGLSTSDDLEESEEDSNGSQTISIRTDGNNVDIDITKEKDEDEGYIAPVGDENITESVISGLNLIGKSKAKAYREENTLFRNMLANNLANRAINESGGSMIDMDTVMANTLIEYTILETLHTSKLVNITPKLSNDYSMKLRIQTNKLSKTI